MSSILYLLLLVALVMFSWVANVCGLMLPDGSLVPSMLSEESVRWFVRHSIEHVSAAPLAQVLLVLLAVGSLRSSGLWSVMWSREGLAQRQRHALYLVLVIFMMYLALVVMELLPGGNLLSVTGYVIGGPFASGWLFVSSVAVVVPSIVYGFVCGQWHSGAEMSAGLASGIGSYASYFITLLVASQLMAAVQYVRLFSLFRLSSVVQSLIEALVYFLPLVLLIITSKTSYETSST